MTDQYDNLRVTRAMNTVQLARTADRIAKNERYLKWFGWFPMAYQVREANEELIKVEAELKEADRLFDKFIGPRDGESEVSEP
jgi:hypothetical protein